MLCPIQRFWCDHPVGSLIQSANGKRFHCDTIFDRANIHTEITRHAFIILNLKHPIGTHRYRLMAGIFARRVAAPALNAIFLVDPRFGHMIEVEILPIGDLGNGFADEVVYRGVRFFIHPFRQARNHLLHDFEPIGHCSRADLYIARPQSHKFGRIAPSCNPTNP